jgi:hypothetical protein
MLNLVGLALFVEGHEQRARPRIHQFVGPAVISGTSRSVKAGFSACSGPSRPAPAGMFEPTPPSTQLYSPWPASYFGDLKK